MNQTELDVILEAEHIVVRYPVKSAVLRRVTGHIHAVEDVSIELRRGETLAIVGESGCGKSTLSRVLVGLLQPTEGDVTYEGVSVSGSTRDQMQELRRRVQIIFQDPFASLNPRRTVRQIIQEAWENHPGSLPRDQWASGVSELLQTVGLDPIFADRYPHQFSGGQQQRIGIARALALRPEVLVCDEPVSALDVSVQGQIVSLLQDLQETYGLSYVFVSHNLALVRMIADRVAVMYLGRIVESGDTDDVFANPLHPYTRALLAAVPIPDPVLAKSRAKRVLEGELPSAENPPSGCAFRTRCPHATEHCANVVPIRSTPNPSTPQHSAACHYVGLI